MQNIAARGTQVPVPPDASKRTDTRPGAGCSKASLGVSSIADAKRSSSVFADTKFNRRLERFQRPGRAAVNSEWRLVHATHNLLKLHRHQLATARA